MSHFAMSPPYWNQRWYGEDSNIIVYESTVAGYVDNLIEIFGQVKKVMKNSESCFVVTSDKFNNGEGGEDTNNGSSLER